MKTLDGKVVVITGAGSGIGRALALNAAAKGAILVLSDVDEVGLLETAEHARTQTAREIRTDKLDVRDRDEMASYAALIAQTMDHLAAEKHERGRAVVVAVDEAHLLTADQLEELRMLTNSEMDSVAPFA